MNVGLGPLSAGEVDGVPVVHAEGPPPMMAALVFRVGRADEAPADGGVTHLVEHLALSTMGRREYRFNGAVEPHFTIFDVAGTADEITDHLHQICVALGDLPRDRFEHEVRVLRTEAQNGGGGFLSSHLAQRYGVRGMGIVGTPEHGLFRLSFEDVRDHAARWFTRDNAVLWVNGPLPDGLRLPLPSGERRPISASTVVEPFLPAYLQLGEGPVSVSFTTSREAVSGVLQDVLERRLWERMRREEGLSYSVQGWAELADADTVVSVLWADMLAENAQAATDAFVRTFEALAEHGPSDSEVHESIARALRIWEDPLGVPARLHRAARRLLVDGPWDEPRSREQLEAVRADDVRTAAAAALDTAILLLPPGAENPGDRFASVQAGSTERVEGTKYSVCDRDLFELAVRPHITIGAEGITYNMGGEGVVTVRWDSCALVLAYDSGVRVVVGDDGFRVTVLPWAWRRGERLVAAIDAAADPAVVVRLPDDGPPPRKRFRPRRLIPRTQLSTWALVLLLGMLGLMWLSALASFLPGEDNDPTFGIVGSVVFGIPTLVLAWESAARRQERA